MLEHPEQQNDANERKPHSSNGSTVLQHVDVCDAQEASVLVIFMGVSGVGLQGTHSPGANDRQCTMEPGLCVRSPPEGQPEEVLD